MKIKIKLEILALYASINFIYGNTSDIPDKESEDSSENIPDGRIIGGKEAKLGQFPYQALLSIVADNGANANCGAALISDRYLLTAGHCARFSNIKVTLGSINSVSLSGPKAVTLTLKKSGIYLHPNFDHWNLINDIAILELPQKVKFSDDVKAAKLPKISESPPDTFVDKEAVITGWGLTETDTSILQVKLRYAYVNVSHILPCLSFYEQFDINDGRICTQYHGKGTCSGDSGGPMALYNNKTKDFTVIGLTSFGTTNCTDNAPSVFTNVAYYLTWIHNITKISIS